MAWQQTTEMFHRLVPRDLYAGEELGNKAKYFTSKQLLYREHTIANSPLGIRTSGQEYWQYWLQHGLQLERVVL